MLIIIAGFVLAFTGLIYVGIAVFSLTALFQIVNLPVEFDASRRAKQELLKSRADPARTRSRRWRGCSTRRR